MTKFLTNAQIEYYHHNGYLSPFNILNAAEVNYCLQSFETIETQFGGAMNTHELRHKPHLIMGWADRLVHNPKILDLVEDLIGPDILCWESALFIKPSQSESYISWHQDLTYWGLDDSDILTVWVALTPSIKESSCVRVIPGSHLGKVVPHKDTFAPKNMLTRGQTIAVDFDETKAVGLELQPGQISLHHVKLFHCSGANHSLNRRIGLAIRYMPTSVSQKLGNGDSATLVRGEDRYGNFELEKRPNGEFDTNALSYRKRLFEQRMNIVMN